MEKAVKLRTGLLVLLVLAIASYGSAKFYVHAKVKGKLDELIRIASPFAEISYGEVKSDLRGKLLVENIALRSTEGAVLQISSIELKGPGPQFLWDLTSGFKNSEPPSHLVLKLNRLSIPTNQSFGGNLGPITLGGQNANPGQPQSCSLGGLLRHAGLEDIGMQTLVADAVMGYSIKRTEGKARVFIEYELIEMESVSLAMSVHGIMQPGAIVMGVIPSIADIDLTYSLEPDYINRMVAHCAQQAQQSNEQFLDSIFAQSDYLIARDLGFAPGPGIKHMLRVLVTSGGVLQLTADPADDMDPATLLAYKPEDIVRLLHLELFLNDEPVNDLSMAFATDDAMRSGMGSQGSADDLALDGTNPAETKTRKESGYARYVETEISDLHRYIGSRVKLYTDNSSKPKTGFLIRYNGRIFSVEQNIYGGTMTAHIQLSELSRAEVLRRVP